MAKTISAVYHNAFRGIRDLFISLLGLKFQSAPKDADPNDFPDIIPLSLLVGRPDALTAALDKSEGEEAAREATEDEKFDEWSKKLAAGDYSDMTPVMHEALAKPEDPNALWYSEEMQQTLEALGIKQAEPENSDGER